LKELPRDKEITVTALMGDAEAFQLATEIFAFLKDNGFNLKESGLSQAIFSKPIKGLAVQPQGDGLNFIVGSNLN
jgi:hypothetical protein